MIPGDLVRVSDPDAYQDFIGIFLHSTSGSLFPQSDWSFTIFTFLTPNGIRNVSRTTLTFEDLEEHFQVL